MDVDTSDDPDDLLFRSSSPLFDETDETESLLLSQEIQDLDAEGDHHLFENFDDDDQVEMLDSAIERARSPVLLEAVFDSSRVGEQGRIPQRRTSSVVNKIESIFNDIHQDLNSGRDEVRLVLSPCYPEIGPGEHAATVSTTDESRKAITFPGRNREEAWRFAVVSRILELVLEALTTGVTITKRDLYYRDPALFGNQPVVDRYVDIIATYFRVSRSELNVYGAAKGLMTGAIKITKKDGTVVDLSQDADPILTTDPDDIEEVDIATIEWVLVIEKEASFQSITASEAWKTLRKHGVAVTGKGYPDLLTRSMLRFMTRPTSGNGFRAPRVYGLMDWDPDGVAILSVYKHGSANKAMDMEDLLASNIQRLGLSRIDIDDREETRYEQGLIPLTGRDRRKARQLLDKALYDEGGAEDGWRLELQTMLMINVKAELQILDEVPGALHKILRGLSLDA